MNLDDPVSSRPKALDLFCKAGGASMGLHLAGFDVTGVDIEPQPNYPFKFIQADALKFKLDGFDFIWASPPCQKHSSLHFVNKHANYKCCIAEVRLRLIESKKPYIIENTPKAPLLNPIQLCGSFFSLKVRRHRIFESNILLTGTTCRHAEQGTPIDVSGTGSRRTAPRTDGKGGNPNKPRNLAEAQEAMGIDWMSRKELSQAIPPAYSKYLGQQLLNQL